MRFQEFICLSYLVSGHHKAVDEQDSGLAIARYGRKSVWNIQYYLYKTYA